MEITSLQQLYIKLIPVFNVKKRLIQNSRYRHITNENIWMYLTEKKWKKSHNLTFADIVNDIITIDLNEINNNIGDENEQI